jgi:hypothetical protein
VIAGALPVQVVGSTLGLPDGNQPSCVAVASGAGDVTFEFTAPANGNYTFDTFGSAYDTALYVLDSCGGLELGCNDDAGGTVQSRVQAPLTAGQTVIIVVDGYGAATGDFVLNVN